MRREAFFALHHRVFQGDAEVGVYGLVLLFDALYEFGGSRFKSAQLGGWYRQGAEGLAGNSVA